MAVHIVRGWSDLERFGIDALTGEACRYGIRLLCDLTASARDGLAEFLGVKVDGFVSNWNRGTDAAPHVASVMLTGAMLPDIARFMGLRNGAAYVADGLDCLGGDSDAVYIFDTEADAAEYRALCTKPFCIPCCKWADNGADHTHPTIGWNRSYPMVGPEVYGRWKKGNGGTGTSRNVHVMTGREV